VVEAWVVGAEGAKTRISAGSRVTLTETVAVTRQDIGPAEAARVLAWRDGRVDFAGETLADAAADFNRYNTRQIVISDAALGRERFYGRFRVEDVDGFAEAVRQTLHATVATGPTEITIGKPTARP
jgi:transmembrane sensor